MTLSKLLVSVIVVVTPVAFAANEAPSPALPVAPAAETLLALETEVCVTLTATKVKKTGAAAEENVAGAVSVAGQRVCTPMRLIPQGHDFPDLSRLRPVSTIAPAS